MASNSQGLTTAASILFCAAVGISVAMRQFVLAVGVTLLAMIVLRGVSRRREAADPQEMGLKTQFFLES